MAPQKKGELNEDEEKLFECINQGDSDEVQRLLAQPTTRVDCLDKNGMIPLQQAAFKANVDVCRLLLAHGADVNSSEHNQGYTALMFASLSGNTEVTQQMLEAGAKVSRENCVGRTASQMAAFVGQYQCVSLINNFFAKDDLAYFTQIQGFETECKLPLDLLTPLYGLIIQNNLDPVGLSLYIQSHLELLDEAGKVPRLLDLLCERMMKQKDTNHVLAIKFHFIGCVVRQCVKSRRQHGDNLQAWIRSMLKGRPEDGFPETQEKFIRSSLKDFPYVDCELLTQIIRTLSKVTLGDDPSALHLLSSTLNGQKFASEDHIGCSTCGKLNKNSKKCATCKMVFYCDKDCQQLHWFTHKKLCKSLAVRYIEITEERRLADERDKLNEEKMKRQKEEEEKKKDEEKDTEENTPGVRYIEITEERRLADERDKLNEEKMKRQKEEEEKKKDEEKDAEENTPGDEKGDDTAPADNDINDGQTGDTPSPVNTEVDAMKCDSEEAIPTQSPSLGGEDQQTDRSAANTQEE